MPRPYNLLRKLTGSPIAVLSLLFAAVCALGFFLNPYSGDDLWFMYRAMNFSGPSGDIDFPGLLKYAATQYEYGDQRLSNFLFLFLILMPKWVTAAISGVSVYAVMRSGCHLAGISSWQGWMILALLFSVFFPWVDQMYLADFQVNYLWPCACGTVLVDELRRGGRRMGVIVILSLFAGLMNEAISIPVMVGLGAVFAMRGGHARRGLIVSFCLLLACVVWVTLCHPYFTRLATEGWFASRRSIVYAYLLPMLLYLLLLVVSPVRKSVPRNDGLQLFMLTSVAVSAFIMVYSMYGPRVGSFGGLMATIGICRLMRLLAGRLSVSVRRIKTGIAVAAAIFLVLHYAAVTYYAEKERRCSESILAIYKGADYKGETIYAPMTLRHSVSPLALQMPYFDVWAHGSTIMPFRLLYGRGKDSSELRPLNVAPEALREHLAAGDTGILLHGDGFRLVGERLILGPYVRREAVNLMADYGDDERVDAYHVVPIPITGFRIRYSLPGDTACWYYREHTDFNSLSPQCLRGLRILP